VWVLSKYFVNLNKDRSSNSFPDRARQSHRVQTRQYIPWQLPSRPLLGRTAVLDLVKDVEVGVSLALVHYSGALQ